MKLFSFVVINSTFPKNLSLAKTAAIFQSFRVVAFHSEVSSAAAGISMQLGYFASSSKRIFDSAVQKSTIALIGFERQRPRRDFVFLGCSAFCGHVPALRAMRQALLALGGRSEASTANAQGADVNTPRVIRG